MAYRTPPLLPPTAIVSLIVLISAYNIVNTINPVNQPKSATEQSELVSKIKSESASREFGCFNAGTKQLRHNVNPVCFCLNKRNNA